MKRIILLLLLFFAFLGAVQAQKDRFQGTWLLQKGNLFWKFTYKSNNGIVSEYLFQRVKNGELVGEGIVKIAQNGSSHLQKNGESVKAWIMFINEKGQLVSEQEKNTRIFDKVPDIEIPRAYKRAIITHVVLERIAPTKPSGDSWDSYIGNYKPDVYAIIKSPAGTEIWRSPYRYDDLDNTRCPVEWSLSNTGGVEIVSEYFVENYKFELWDMDNTNAHDDMGSGYFSLQGQEGKDYTFEGGNGQIKIKLKIRWE